MASSCVEKTDPNSAHRSNLTSRSQYEWMTDAFCPFNNSDRRGFEPSYLWLLRPPSTVLGHVLKLSKCGSVFVIWIVVTLILKQLVELTWP